jgi:hypothetical protein
MSKLTRPKSNKFFWWTEYVDEKGFESMAFNTNYAEIAGILAWFIDQTETFEQERIIKLLEHMPRTDNDKTIDAVLAIALIKGENK